MTINASKRFSSSNRHEYYAYDDGRDDRWARIRVQQLLEAAKRQELNRELNDAELGALIDQLDQGQVIQVQFDPAFIRQPGIDAVMTYAGMGEDGQVHIQYDNGESFSFEPPAGSYHEPDLYTVTRQPVREPCEGMDPQYDVFDGGFRLVARSVVDGSSIPEFDAKHYPDAMYLSADVLNEPLDGGSEF